VKNLGGAQGNPGVSACLWLARRRRPPPDLLIFRSNSSNCE